MIFSNPCTLRMTKLLNKKNLEVIVLSFNQDTITQNSENALLNIILLDENNYNKPRKLKYPYICTHMQTHIASYCLCQFNIGNH